MRCERCDGSGYDGNTLTEKLTVKPIPCPDCGGTGIRHCCDGEDIDGGNDVTKGADDRSKS